MKIITIDNKGVVAHHPDQELYVLVSVKHTSESKYCIEFWRPNWSGYTAVVGHAGLYSEKDARLIADGENTLAVPWKTAYSLAAPTPYYTGPCRAWQLYAEEGPVVQNTTRNWIALSAAHIGRLTCAKFPVSKGFLDFTVRMSTKS